MTCEVDSDVISPFFSLNFRRIFSELHSTVQINENTAKNVMIRKNSAYSLPENAGVRTYAPNENSYPRYPPTKPPITGVEVPEFYQTAYMTSELTSHIILKTCRILLCVYQVKFDISHYYR